jgi:hypothetical protein
VCVVLRVHEVENALAQPQDENEQQQELYVQLCIAAALTPHTQTEIIKIKSYKVTRQMGSWIFYARPYALLYTYAVPTALFGHS